MWHGEEEEDAENQIDLNETNDETDYTNWQHVDVLVWKLIVSLLLLSSDPVMPLVLVTDSPVSESFPEYYYSNVCIPHVHCEFICPFNKYPIQWCGFIATTAGPTCDQSEICYFQYFLPISSS